MDSPNNELMSTNVNDLNDMELLSSTIEKEVDQNKIKKVLSSDDIMKLQELQKTQLEQIEKMNELKEQINNDVTESFDENTTSKSIINEATNLILEPLILLIIFIFINNEYVLNLIKYVIPNIEGNGIISLITRAIFFLIFYFLIKFIFL